MHGETAGNGHPRVAYILKRFPRLSETFIANEIIALERRGFEIAVFSMKDPKEKVHSFLARMQSPVHYLPPLSRGTFLTYFFAHLSAFVRRPLGYTKCLLYARHYRSDASLKKFFLAGYLAKQLLDGRFDHLHSHFASGSTRLAKYAHIITGIPYSFTAHAKDIFSDRVSLGQLQRRMEKARFVVTITEYNRKHLSKISPRARLHVIRNGIDIVRFSRNGDHSRANETPVILAVGRLVEKKGFLYLVEACAGLVRKGLDFQCVIVGDGPEKDELEARIRGLDLSGYVTLAGPKTQEELLREYYAKATIFVLPCTVAQNSDMDGLPVVLQEAMALGIPVLSCPITGIPELVRHMETGIMAPPGDPIGLTAAMEQLLKDGALRERLSASARELVVREYDIERTSEQLARLFGGGAYGS